MINPNADYNSNLVKFSILYRIFNSSSVNSDSTSIEFNTDRTGCTRFICTKYSIVSIRLNTLYYLLLILSLIRPLDKEFLTIFFFNFYSGYNTFDQLWKKLENSKKFNKDKIKNVLGILSDKLKPGCLRLFNVDQIVQ